MDTAIHTLNPCCGLVLSSNQDNPHHPLFIQVDADGHCKAGDSRALPRVDLTPTHCTCVLGTGFAFWVLSDLKNQPNNAVRREPEQALVPARC